MWFCEFARCIAHAAMIPNIPLYTCSTDSSQQMWVDAINKQGFVLSSHKTINDEVSWAFMAKVALQKCNMLTEFCLFYQIILF